VPPQKPALDAERRRVDRGVGPQPGRLQRAAGTALGVLVEPRNRVAHDRESVGVTNVAARWLPLPNASSVAPSGWVKVKGSSMKGMDMVVGPSACGGRLARRGRGGGGA
jgi:hypothetical protein